MSELIGLERSASAEKVIYYNQFCYVPQQKKRPIGPEMGRSLDPLRLTDADNALLITEFRDGPGGFLRNSLRFVPCKPDALLRS
jgi:hypothetical protein